MLRYQQVFAPILGFLALWYSVVNGAFGTALSGAQMEVVKLVRAMRPSALPACGARAALTDRPPPPPAPSPPARAASPLGPRQLWGIFAGVYFHQLAVGARLP
jgi:hypothetical protein